MRMQLAIRFDYGSEVPWVYAADGGVLAVAGPDAVRLDTPVKTVGQGLTTVAEFAAEPGKRVPFSFASFRSFDHPPARFDAEAALAETDRWWREWSGRCTYKGERRDLVVRSLLTLKALTYQPSGGIVAAATTSLPEKMGGVRNWDYRYCWLRDATLTLLALINAGYADEAKAWRQWLLRAVAGDPTTTQIMYGLGGERRLIEWEVKGCRATKGRSRCGSVTRPTASSSSTCTAKSATPCIRPGSPAWSRPPAIGTWRRRWSTSWRRRGTGRTKACGRCAARGGTSPTRR